MNSKTKKIVTSNFDKKLEYKWEELNMTRSKKVTFHEPTYRLQNIISGKN